MGGVTTVPLDLLLVESSKADAELIILSLQQAGYSVSWRQVEDETTFRAALDKCLPDAILSDWTLPRFSGRAAIAIARDRCPGAPFLFVSATTDDASVVEILRQGADAYVHKHQLTKLGAALARPLSDAGKLGIARDLAERLRAEEQRAQQREQVHQARKMDAIGQLTGGIAHDFNNLLGVLIGNLDLARERLLGDPEGLELIDAALDAGLRGAELNKRLLATARCQPLQPQGMNVDDTLENIVKLLRRTLGGQIDIRNQRSEASWPIKVDAGQFENAIVNLGVNARDAMPTGGQLTIECRNVSADESFAACHAGVTPGDYVVISVSDTGCGMTPEVLNHAFEPFYTGRRLK